ncbi:MAG: aspartate-semialdehyde dehydrogenase [Armatimonadota bacterium]|nr:aspartate-semialdehyde dehydrogenase [Armatimonadota bacterium]
MTDNRYNVAIVGVGAVGEELLRVLAEHHFPAREIRVLARSERTITVDGQDYPVRATTPEAFDGIDLALFAGTEGEKGAAVTFGPEAVRRGAIVIDNGADYRMRADVPLVVPEVNAQALDGHQGIIANPNCSTAQLVLALKPLHDAARVTRVLVSTYQAVSGAGSGAVGELKAQNEALAEGRAISAPGPAFPVQIAGNVIPQIGGFDDQGYTSEEMKLVHETRKIMGDSSIRITPMVTARVPVAIGHSEAVYVETERPLTPDDARALWHDFPGLAVLDEKNGADPYRAYPTPLFAAGKDTTFVGRIRQDLGNPHGLNFWIVSDNLRKGAATNAVQIAEAIIQRGLVRHTHDS